MLKFDMEFGFDEVGIFFLPLLDNVFGSAFGYFLCYWLHGW
jgi:hypothetical protein